MAVVIQDPTTERAFRNAHEASDASKWDEVWEGVLHVPPLPNNEHQAMVYTLMAPAYDTIVGAKAGMVYPGVNVSDRVKDWQDNYRCPDLAVYLNSNPAINHGTHWTGGPDFLVEIISPGQDAHEKIGFYSRVHTREVLIVHRHPWALELFQSKDGMLTVVGKSELADPRTLASGVLPLTFQLVPGANRPMIRVSHTTSGQVWTA